VSGPYDTAAQVAADCGWARKAPATRGAHIDPNIVRLTRACDEAGVVLGAHDRHLIEWLANWEAETVQVVADLIDRAHASGQREGRSS
jgi:hypothetical protein